MNEQTVTPSVTEVPTLTAFEQRWLAQQEKARKSYLQKVHGRSKYVVHQGAREKARRLKQEAR